MDRDDLDRDRSLDAVWAVPAEHSPYFRQDRRSGIITVRCRCGQPGIAGEHEYMRHLRSLDEYKESMLAARRFAGELVEPDLRLA